MDNGDASVKFACSRLAAAEGRELNAGQRGPEGQYRTDVRYSPVDGGRVFCFIDLNVLLIVHCAELNPCLLFNLSCTSLKVEQGERRQPFVLDSVFQISEDEGRG